MVDKIKRRMKQGFICLFILFGLILGNLPKEVFAELPDTDFYSGKIVVKTENLENLPPGGEIVSENNGMYLVDYVSPSEAERAYLAMENNPDILASPESSFVVCRNLDVQKNVPKETEQALSYIEEDVPDYSGKNVIALIDTGANSSDVLGCYSVISGDGKDDNGHGTLMVKAIKSIDESANIVSIKALNKKGAGSISSVYSAIKLAIKMKVKVINLSIVAKSVDENEIIKDVIREALNSNIVVVGAAGNSSDLATNYIPGCISGVIIAASCDDKGNRLNSSNYGEGVDWNIFSESTSEASAILSGFIAKNCNNDKTLSTRLLEEDGKGLIFSAYKKEVASSPQYDEEISDINWRDFNLNSLSENDKAMFSKGNELTGLKLSEDGKYLMITTTDYAVPDDGSFVPAAWEYAKVTSSSVLRMNNTVGGPGMKENQNQVSVVTNPDGTISSTGNLLDGYNYRIIGYTFNYIPGTFEKSPLVKGLGSEAVDSQSMKLLSKWNDGLWDNIVSSGEKTFHIDNQTGMVQLSFWPVANTCLKYLYRSNIKLYLKDLPFNQRPVRSSYKTNEHSIWYEEGNVGTAERVEIATEGTPPYHAEVGLSLRKYKVYYQRSGDAEDLFYAGSGIVGAPFKFSEAEEAATPQIANKTLGWNYDAFGSQSRPSDSTEVIPKKTTPEEVGEDGEVYYKFVVTPSGSNKPGKAKLTVVAKGNLAKVPGAEFKLMSKETVVKESLVTNEDGEILLEDLLWEESWDMEHDGVYVLIPVSVPLGYHMPREVPFEIVREDALSGNIPELKRILEIEDKPISLESVVNEKNAPRNIFSYTISGTDVSGKECTYFCTSNERYERMLPAGTYKVTVLGKPGYKRLDTEYLEGFSVGDVVDLARNLRGSIRYIWEYNDKEGGSSGDVCINRFRK